MPYDVAKVWYTTGATVRPAEDAAANHTVLATSRFISLIQKDSDTTVKRVVRGNTVTKQ